MEVVEETKQSYDEIDDVKSDSTQLQRSSGCRKISFQLMIFVLTYISYAVLHFTREGWSILKTDVESDEPPGLDWEGNNNAGLVDFFFLFAYSFGLFVSGVLGDNYPIRVILPIGYLIVCLMVLMISLGGTWQITNVFYYIVFFVISGFFQSIGWPSYIAVMGNWFSEDSRGLIFGIWWTCQNIGNIGGNLLVNLLRSNLGLDWTWNFRIIGFIVGGVGILNAILLIDHPYKVGIVIDEPKPEERRLNKYKSEAAIKAVNKTSSDLVTSKTVDKKDISDSLLDNRHRSNDRQKSVKLPSLGSQMIPETHAISFWRAWLIPGVIPFVIWIAFVKCATYGMLFWLPAYADQNLDFNNSEVGMIAIAYDVGTIFGSIVLGKWSDITYKKRSPVAFTGLVIGGVLFLIVAFFSSKL